jgi:hypothetical protein
MKIPVIFCSLFLLPLVFSIGLRADDSVKSLSEEKKAQIITAVTAADDERVAAMIAADGKRLDVSFSDELRYGHSNGKIDGKASYINQFVSRRSLYETYRYTERSFTVLAPEAVAVRGRVLIHVRRSDATTDDLDLNFLALWRQEKGQWKFFASQSTRAAAPAPVPSTVK